MTAARAESAPNPAQIFEMLNAHQRTSALRTAIELDVFRAIGETPGDLASIASACGASERGMRILCDFLVVDGLLAKEDGRYRHTPLSATFLDPRSPACMGSMARFLLLPETLRTYDQLTEIVKTGRTVLPGHGSVEGENPIWVEFARSMAPMAAPAAGPLAEIALDGLAGPLHVLDIAAGHGLFGIAAGRARTDVRVTALDWESVLAVAKENAAKAGVADRYDTIAGSAFDVDFGGPYDVVLLTNFLHHYSQAECIELLKKVRASLRPGGRSVTLEFVTNEDRVTPRMAAAFAIIMLASTAEGDAYTFSEYEAMHRAAGFASVTAQPLPSNPQTAVIGINR